MRRYRLPYVFWMAVKMRMGLVPAINFNHERYKELIRKCPVSIIPPGSDDPEVEFAYDEPFDGVLGTYDRETKRITIDVLEIFVLTSEAENINSLEDFMREYDHSLTRVLAHEGGHWHLDKRLGWFETFVKYAAMTLFWSAVLVISTFTILTGYGLFLSLHYVVGSLLAERVNNLVELAILLPFTLLSIILGKFWYKTWKMISLALSYQVCYHHERFAKKFESLPQFNSEWEDVVVVEMEHEISGGKLSSLKL